MDVIRAHLVSPAWVSTPSSTGSSAGSTKLPLCRGQRKAQGCGLWGQQDDRLLGLKPQPPPASGMLSPDESIRARLSWAVSTEHEWTQTWAGAGRGELSVSLLPFLDSTTPLVHQLDWKMQPALLLEASFCGMCQGKAFRWLVYLPKPRLC